jgi:5-formyltetrahydrofolate cyclo-ligase
MDKTEWRQKLRSQRDSLEAPLRKKEEFSILTHLKPWVEDGSLSSWMVYLPFGSEVDTSLLTESLWEKGRDVFAPRMLNQGELGSVQLMKNTTISTQQWGIPEPNGPLMPKEFRADVIVTPGLGYDRQGNRLGYGKGYYDRFLSTRPKFCLGLGFSCQIAEQLTSEKHDQSLDAVISADGVIFQRSTPN